MLTCESVITKNTVLLHHKHQLLKAAGSRSNTHYKTQRFIGCSTMTLLKADTEELQGYYFQLYLRNQGKRVQGELQNMLTDYRARCRCAISFSAMSVCASNRLLLAVQIKRFLPTRHLQYHLL